MPTVDIDAVTGDVNGGPDHYEHLGAVFDFEATDLDATYPKPRSGDQWGDIIPPVPLFNQDGTPLLGEDEQQLWTTGLNWTEVGQAIYENDCQPPGEERAAVIVAKDVPGVASTDLFLFTVNGSTPPTQIGDDDYEEFAVDPGTVTVSEDLTNPTGYTLTGVACTRTSGGNPHGTPVSVTPVGGAVTFEIAAGEVVSCTFTNAVGQRAPQLTVEKVVSGTPPAGATFEVDITREGPPAQLVADNVAIAVGDPHSVSGAGTYDVDEVTRGGATSTSWACYLGASTTPFASGAGFEIDDVVVAQTDVRCVFTNTYTPEIPPFVPPPTPVPASLTVEKDVTGDVPADWEFTFRLRGGATNELFTLDDGDDDEAFSLAAGTYVLSEFEVPNDGAVLVDVECLAGDDDATGTVDEGVVTLELVAGDDVTCTFTNDFAEVAPSVVTTTTTTTTVAPATTTTTTTVAPAAVLGETITRLPRTGSHTGQLAGLGVVLIGLGAAMVLVERRREMSHS